MVYLDYSATTPVNDEVLDSFNKVCKNYIGNANSLHKLGFESFKVIESATSQIANLLNIKNDNIIYTSGASESNNLAIKGICLKYQNRGKKIITTDLEHSSIYGPLDYLKNLGFEIKYVNVDENGMVDLNHLESLMDDDVILVTITAVNSEIGLIEPIKEIGKIVKKYSKCYFHTDITQYIGKYPFDNDFFNNVDLASFSAHKFYGLKGIGCLIKKGEIDLEPLIHGGKSTSSYRSGTPTAALIVSLAKALRLAFENSKQKYEYVLNLNKKVRETLEKYDDVVINSNNYSIPHILNISVLGIKPETMLHALEEDNIYISTKSACSNSNEKSRAVYALTKDEKRAISSLRISLSHLTTENDIDLFLESFEKWHKKLKLR